MSSRRPLVALLIAALSAVVLPMDGDLAGGGDQARPRSDAAAFAIRLPGTDALATRPIGDDRWETATSQRLAKQRLLLFAAAIAPLLFMATLRRRRASGDAPASQRHGAWWWSHSGRAPPALSS